MPPSTPSHPRSILSSSPTSSPNVQNPQQKAFGRGRKIVREAVEAGLWYSFGSRSIDSPDIIEWPLREDGTKFLPEEMPEAFGMFKIPDPYCLCTTLHPTGPVPPDPYFKLHIRVCSTDGDYYGQVIAGCRRQKKGCGLWILLQDLYNNEELPCRVYERRTVRRIGLPTFNESKIDITPTVPFNPHLPLSTPTPSIDLHPQVNGADAGANEHVEDDASSSASTEGSNKRKRDTEPLEIESTSTASPIPDPIVKKEKKARRIRKRQSDPSRPGGPSNPYIISSGDECDQDDIRPKPSNTSMESKRDSAQQPFYYHRTYPPSERFFGDTYPLANPVDRSLLGIRNSDIPFLSDMLNVHYCHALGETGVPADVFWLLVDRCNCGLFFWKDHLHRVHGPRCDEWMRFMANRPRAPLPQDAIATIDSFHTLIPFPPSYSSPITSSASAAPENSSSQSSPMAEPLTTVEPAPVAEALPRAHAGENIDVTSSFPFSIFNF